jgi:four helix bundle protein
MPQPTFESLQVYQLAEKLAGEVWSLVTQWRAFAQDTIGKQLVRAADGIGSNLAEGYGRGSHADNNRFVFIARGSLNETLCWIQRASTRKLMSPEQSQGLVAITTELGPRLNAYLNYISKQIKSHEVRGQSATE